MGPEDQVNDAEAERGVVLPPPSESQPDLVATPGADGESAATIVVIDQEQANLDLIRNALSTGNFELHCHNSPVAALKQIEALGADLILTDLHTPELDGFALLEIVRQRWPECPVIIFTAYGGVQDAVHAIKAGAADFLTKPLNPEAIPEMVRQILEFQTQNAPKEERFIGSSAPKGSEIPGVFELAAAVAPSNCNLLITGESGTGKEVLADFIWANSPRKSQPYIKVDCAALSETLVESELFGHERGAFTGANRRHVGRFERAHGGTLFLDEIGELSLTMQTKLLRVLQTHEIERVGGASLIKVDFRLICATHRNLPQMIIAGKFRQDLYYRINTFPIRVPPLRERRGEIAELCAFFLKRCRTALQRGPLDISPEAGQLLENYPWPGNVRELEHCLERACLLAQAPVLQASDLWWLNMPAETLVSAFPASAAALPAAATLLDAGNDGELSPLERAEKTTLKETLDKHNWNFTHAATALDISRSTLYLKARKYGLVRLGA